MKKEHPSIGRSVVRVQNVSTFRKQAGFGALEVMIAIIVGLFAILGAVAWYSKLSTTSNNQTELENVSSLITNIRTLRTSSGYGTVGSLNTVLVSTNGIPETMRTSGSNVYNAWDGAVTAASTGAGYTLTYASVPAAGCIFLATKSPSSSATSLKINGGTAINGEVTQTAAAAGCSTDTNTLVWSGR